VVHELQITQDRCGRLDREIEDTRVRLKALESEREDVLDDISHWGSFMVPFRPLRIPAEILSEIFRIFVIEDGGSPWTLTKVSSAFRRTALSTPRIWGGISLWGEEKHGYGPQVWYRPTVKSVRWEFGKENCCTAKQLRQALKRARAVPLDLAINCRGGYPIAIGDKAKEMISMVAGERFSQWRSLEFAVDDNWDLRDVFSGSLEGLTFLRLNSFHQDLYDCLCKTARSLRNVEILMRNQPLSKLANAPWWQHIHRLLLEVPLQHLDTTGVPTTQCASAVDILSKAVALEDLTVQLESYNEFMPPNQPLHFPRMKKLALESSAGLLPTISAPLLTHMEIRTGAWSNVATFNPGSIFLPAVTHLSVFSSAPPVLASFYCPSLVQLRLGPDLSGGDHNDPVVNLAWSPDNDPEKHLKPSVLRIESLVITWTVLRDLLRFSLLRDCIRELYFVNSPLPKSFFKALMAVAPSTVICKDLVKLSVIYKSDVYNRRIMGSGDGKAILKSIFTLRREQNLGLRRVIAQWPKVSRVEFSEDNSGICGVSAGAA